MVAKTPRLLTAEQREAFVRLPADLSERDLGRFYTLSARDLEIIGRRRRPANVTLPLGAKDPADLAPLAEGATLFRSAIEFACCVSR